MAMPTKCPNCNGTARVSSGAQCIECSGTGRVSHEAAELLTRAAKPREEGNMDEKREYLSGREAAELIKWMRAVGHVERVTAEELMHAGNLTRDHERYFRRAITGERFQAGGRA